MNYEQALEAVKQGKKVRWSRFSRRFDHVFMSAEGQLMYANHQPKDNAFGIAPWTPDPTDKTSETWEIIDI